jgi:hypothetical protein
MASTTAFCTSAKVEIMKGLHIFLASGGSTFKGALYTSTATNGAATTTYSTTNEITGTGYTAAGNTLTVTDATSSGTTAYTDFADTSWTSSTITAASLLIYNNTGTKAISVHDFGGNVSTTSGTFTVVFPTPDATNAILRIS